MKFLTALKTIASAIVWGLGQLFNRQYLKSLFFFVIFAGFIMIEISTSKYFVDDAHPNQVALDKVAGESIKDWHQTSFLARYDAYVANGTILDTSDDRPIVEFEEYLASINVNRGTDGQYFSSYEGNGRWTNPSAVNFTEDKFIEYFAMDLQAASYTRYTQVTTAQNPTVILDEDFDLLNATHFITKENLFVDVTNDPSFDSETAIPEDPSTWVFYREINTLVNGNNIKEYVETYPLFRLPSDVTPNRLSSSDVAALVENGNWKTFNKNGAIFRASGVHYVGVSFNSTNPNPNRYLLLSTTNLSLRIKVESGANAFNPLERPLIIGPLYEQNGVLFEKYQAGLLFNGNRLQYNQTTFSNIFRETMAQTYTITPNLISSSSFIKLMLRVWFDLNPDVRDQFYNDYNNFFFDEAGLFVKGYWEVITLGQAKKLEMYDHLSLVNAMIGRAGESANSNIRSHLSYDGAIVVMGHVSTQLLLEGLIAVILSLFFFIAGIWNVIDAFKVAEYKRNELKRLGWIIKPVPVYELIILDILTLGLFRIIWNYFGVRAIKHVTKDDSIQIWKEFFLMLIPFYGATRLSNLARKLEQFSHVEDQKLSKTTLITTLFLVSGIVANCMIQQHLNQYLTKAKPAKQIKMTSMTKLAFLIIITGGIYIYVWLYKAMRDVKILTKDNQTKIWLQMLLSILIPFYSVYSIIKLENILYKYRLKEHPEAEPYNFTPLMIGLFVLTVSFAGLLVFINNFAMDVAFLMRASLGVTLAILLGVTIYNLIASIKLAKANKYPFSAVKEILLHLIPFYALMYLAKIHKLTSNTKPLSLDQVSKRASWMYLVSYFVLGVVLFGLAASLEFISIDSANTSTGQSIIIYSVMSIIGFMYAIGMFGVLQEQLNVEISRLERDKDPLLILAPELVDPNAEEHTRTKPESLSGARYFKHIWDTGFEYIVLMPALFVLGFISIMPIAFGFVIAFTSISGSESMIDTFNWVALENFVAIFNFDSVLGRSFGVAFWRVLSWTVVWAIFSTFTVFFGGFFQALIINSESIVFRKLWRTILILPWAIPALLSQMVFSVIFNENGLVNQILQTVGMYDLFIDWGILGIPYSEATGLAQFFWMGDGNIGWFSNTFNPNFVRASLIVVNIWLGFPYFMALMTGIMTAIDKSLYEAADIDGASGFQKLMKITMPLVLYSTAPILIMTFSGNFNNFGVIYFITGGGPNDNVASLGFAGDTDILISWMYKLTTDYAIYNMASVFSVLIFLFVGSVTAWNLSRTRAFQED